MRKSERIRLLEMQMVRMEYEIEYIKAAVVAFLEKNNVTPPDLDAGKWYRGRMNGKHEG